VLLPGGGLFALTNFPQYDIVQGTNAPIDNTGFAVGESQFWKFPLRGYTSGDITVDVYWYAAATTGNVKWETAIGAVTIATDTGSLEAKAFATATSTQTAVNSNAKAGSKTTITITGSSLDSAAANDFIQFYLKRIAASASEMSGDSLFLYAVVSWS
jgi:hypothetical protein